MLSQKLMILTMGHDAYDKFVSLKHRPESEPFELEVWVATA